LDSDHYPLELQDQYDLNGMPVSRVFLSAHSGVGLSGLRTVLSEIVKTALPNLDPSEPDPRDIGREYQGDSP
jgi:GTP-binding protein HflX